MHTAHVFTAGDDDGDTAEAFRRMSPPDNELPAPLDLRVELLRTADVCVALVGGRAYTTGVLLDLVLTIRPGSLTPEDRRTRFFGTPPFADMLVGVTLPGGETVSTLAAQPWGLAGADPGETVLVQHGGGSSDTGAESSVWLAPPPAAGRMGLVVAYPELGVGEVHAEIDAAVLARACAAAVVLWPHEESHVHDEPMLPERELEPGGWFDRHRPAVEPDDET